MTSKKQEEESFMAAKHTKISIILENIIICKYNGTKLNILNEFLMEF